MITSTLNVISHPANDFRLEHLIQEFGKSNGRIYSWFLIDEYDVPLDKSFRAGCYDEMAALIRGLLGNALKTNDYLQFAVLTGCLRISKESIFTGLNNFKVLSVAEVQFDEAFGFTDGEVREMLKYYELSNHYDEMKEWYDGYQFGNVEVYCQRGKTAGRVSEADSQYPGYFREEADERKFAHRESDH